jgi:rSAM/selenodomain-associated transferase 2
MNYSIIIPTLNEEKYIGRTLGRLHRMFQSIDHEIIIVDAGSTDQTLPIASTYKINIITSTKKCRATQLNLGAKYATGDVLYFIHADVLPNADCINKIEQALSEGKQSGCFSYQFDSSRLLLKINSKATRSDSMLCGGGDQTLFIKRSLFEEMNGFNEEYVIMEDFELTQRLRKKNAFTVIPHDVIVSARKYEKNSYLRVQLANLVVFTMFKMGMAPKKMAEYYGMLLR